tara:strand:- start:81 stop:569 length:489 start_codon:yes stop_codon:yes gene_type:complete
MDRRGLGAVRSQQQLLKHAPSAARRLLLDENTVGTQRRVLLAKVREAIGERVRTTRCSPCAQTRVGLLGANDDSLETLESGLPSEMSGGFFRQSNIYEFTRWYTFRERDNVIPESPRELFQSGDVLSEVSGFSHLGLKLVVTVGVNVRQSAPVAIALYNRGQ